MSAQKNHLIEAVVLTTYNICFGLEMRKLIFDYTLLTRDLAQWLNLLCIWFPDWSKLPAELKIKEKKERKLKSSVKPNVSAAKKRKADNEVDISKALEVSLALGLCKLWMNEPMSGM